MNAIVPTLAVIAAVISLWSLRSTMRAKENLRDAWQALDQARAEHSRLKPLPPDAGLLWFTDKITPCPDCSTTLPAASIILLRNAVERDGQRLVVISGERLSCQMCGAIYSVGPNGTFKHSPRALPQTPGPEREGPPQRPQRPIIDGNEDGANDDPDPPPRFREPRERPRV